MAHKWSDRRKKPQTAVIVFKMCGDTQPGDTNIFSKRNGKSFQAVSDDWKKVIRFFRFKKNLKMVDGLSESKQLKSLDYIFGPIADGKIRPPLQPNRNWNPKAFKPIKYQLCLQTQAMADAFYNDGKNVEKVIFFYDTN